MVEGLIMRMLKKEEERIGQYASKARARTRARQLTCETKRPHQIFLTHTWRDLEPVVCWTVCLAMVWRGGSLVLA